MVFPGFRITNMSHIHSQWLHNLKSVEAETGAHNWSSFQFPCHEELILQEWPMRRKKNVTARPFTKSSELQLQETIKG